MASSTALEKSESPGISRSQSSSGALRSIAVSKLSSTCTSRGSICSACTKMRGRSARVASVHSDCAISSNLAAASRTRSRAASPSFVNHASSRSSEARICGRCAFTAATWLNWAHFARTPSCHEG
eukprot:729701-Pleurochrysis_carterae.AAC.1